MNAPDGYTELHERRSETYRNGTLRLQLQYTTSHRNTSAIASTAVVDTFTCLNEHRYHILPTCFVPHTDCGVGRSRRSPLTSFCAHPNSREPPQTCSEAGPLDSSAVNPKDAPTPDAITEEHARYKQDQKYFSDWMTQTVVTLEKGVTLGYDAKPRSRIRNGKASAGRGITKAKPEPTINDLV